MQSAPWKGKSAIREGADYPATWISHGDSGNRKFEENSAVEFCRKLTEQERKSGRLPLNWKYALPTEAQWEYACRAGTRTAYGFGDNVQQLGDYAWYDRNLHMIKEEYAHQVGRKAPNDWGLSDMHGNVWEWCSDWYTPKLPGGRDPIGASAGSLRIFRGGGWRGEASFCRSADRSWDLPVRRYNRLGFRVAGVPSSK